MSGVHVLGGHMSLQDITPKLSCAGKELPSISDMAISAIAILHQQFSDLFPGKIGMGSVAAPFSS